jgi:hypothetical protein
MDDEPQSYHRSSYNAALREITSQRKDELSEIERDWAIAVTDAFDMLEKIVFEKLNDDYRAAVMLIIEMRKDLFNFMPMPMSSEDESENKEINPREPRDVRDEIISIARFIEWILFRKMDFSPSKLVNLFDADNLSEATNKYCRSLEDVLTHVRADLAPGNMTSQTTSSIGRHLKLVSVSKRK